MWISKRRYRNLKREVAELRKMVEYQQFILEMCKKIDMSAKELKRKVKEDGCERGIKETT